MEATQAAPRKAKANFLIFTLLMCFEIFYDGYFRQIKTAVISELIEVTQIITAVVSCHLLMTGNTRHKTNG